MSGNRLNISGNDLQDFSDANDDILIWIEDLKKQMKCNDEKDFSAERFMRQSKETLSKCLFAAYQVVFAYQESFKDVRRQVENLKSDVIESQRSVVKLQQDLLDVKSEQLKSMTTVVDTAVEKGIKSYSQAVSNSLPQSAPSFTEEKLKKVVQEAVADEDRSRNIMVFGMEEGTGEDLGSKITEMFDEISEKPSFEAARVGRKLTEKIRPVKVSLHSSGTVHQILVKAKKLRSSTTYRSVYIAPDRSPDERLKQKELIAEVKRKMNEDPSKHYYVKSGRIFSKDKG